MPLRVIPVVVRELKITDRRLLGFGGDMNSPVFPAGGAYAELSKASQESLQAKRCRCWQVGGQQDELQQEGQEVTGWVPVISVTTKGCSTVKRSRNHLPRFCLS